MFYIFNLAFLFLLHSLRAEGGSNARQSSVKVFAEDSPPYLELPVFQHSRVPLVDKEHFSPVRGTGHEQLPDKVRKILVPVYPTQKPSGTKSQAREVITLCNINKMFVQVKKNILGSGSSLSQLTLGTCQANKSTKVSLIFEYDLGLCGSKRSLVNNRVAYSNTLRYDPPKIQGPIRRAAPFTLRVVCHFNRYHYSYKIGYMLNVVHKVSKPMKNRTRSMLTARNAQWERLAPSDGYSMGKPMYFQVEVPSMSKDGRLYVHSCNVTIKQSHSSTPQFTVIDNFGCMVESKNNSGSRFIPYKRNVVRFTMDAFLFQAMTAGQLKPPLQPQQLYMYCAMSVGRSVPSSTAKACTYDSAAGGWKELYGASSVCSCCESTCSSAVPSATTKMVTSKSWSVEYSTKPAQELTTTSQPETVVAGQLGVRQVERLKERPVKGFAVVEVEQVSEPHRIFEDFFGVDK
ncbi:zona pellucida sperm-binding protein 3d.2 [Oncorhynchus tshawytscha]|uniref:zona pellucida sperm-binding protein 3d.2 n=1 Tax=Oncorhynchus tshawytscha TaxID=74940 RepID=UPI000D0A4225|nr:zona pellucida sperm-binding protein 3d.2 [Oncorhynchus tshawytscha]